ncbi:putative membrane protein [Methylorubrum rhodinum]|uniref:Putative membrane protein n=1 Tax=Methylorubrum rhodinum TaxID=29428 RepID=A0A840ZU57_9HYPH|nr:hypothetical protein [Methylorubrum rhodinum]MBB5760381.1 putative membrane protein [Methylorubrum rhodinum]
MVVREVREDVREDVERALGGVPLPAQKKQEVATAIGAAVERYISPYPHPDVIAQIDKLAPGSAALIVQTAVDTIRHNNEIEKRELDLKEKEIELVDKISTADYGSVSQGRKYGLFAFVCILLFSAGMYYLGAEKLAYIAFGVGSLAIVGQLILGGGHKFSLTTSPPGEGEGESEVPPSASMTKPDKSKR